MQGWGKSPQQPPVVAPFLLLNLQRLLCFFPPRWLLCYTFYKNLCRVHVTPMIECGDEVRLTCDWPRYHGHMDSGTCQKNLCPLGWFTDNWSISSATADRKAPHSESESESCFNNQIVEKRFSLALSSWISANKSNSAAASLEGAIRSLSSVRHISD